MGVAPKSANCTSKTSTFKALDGSSCIVVVSLALKISQLGRSFAVATDALLRQMRLLQRVPPLWKGGLSASNELGDAAPVFFLCGSGDFCEGGRERVGRVAE